MHHCCYVKMFRTGVTCIFTSLHNSSEGMFLCLPEELYILSAFFVCHIHSEAYIHMYILVICFRLNLSSLLFHYAFLCSPSIYPFSPLPIYFFVFSFNLSPHCPSLCITFCSPSILTSSSLLFYVFLLFLLYSNLYLFCSPLRLSYSLLF